MHTVTCTRTRICTAVGTYKWTTQSGDVLTPGATRAKCYAFLDEDHRESRKPLFDAVRSWCTHKTSVRCRDWRGSPSCQSKTDRVFWSTCGHNHHTNNTNNNTTFVEMLNNTAFKWDNYLRTLLNRNSPWLDPLSFSMKYCSNVYAGQISEALTNKISMALDHTFCWNQVDARTVNHNRKQATHSVGNVNLVRAMYCRHPMLRPASMAGGPPLQKKCDHLTAYQWIQRVNKRFWIGHNVCEQAQQVHSTRVVRTTTLERMWSHLLSQMPSRNVYRLSTVMSISYLSATTTLPPFWLPATRWDIRMIVEHIITHAQMHTRIKKQPHAQETGHTNTQMYTSTLTYSV